MLCEFLDTFHKSVILNHLKYLASKGFRIPRQTPAYCVAAFTVPSPVYYSVLPILLTAFTPKVGGKALTRRKFCISGEMFALEDKNEERKDECIHRCLNVILLDIWFD